MKDDVELVEIEPGRSSLHSHSKVKVDDYSEKKTKHLFKLKKKKDNDSNNKKKKRPFKKWEKILVAVSWTFFAVCLAFYGYRFVKYYKIYNPKIDGKTAELLMTSIVKKSTIVYEGDGLYRISGNYVYKGASVNNYIRYSGMLWRILKFNTDGSVDIVTDEGINMLKWDNDAKKFSESDIYKYLNEYFYKKIDSSDLATTASCQDEITDLNKITCNDLNSKGNVRLLGVSEYLNSKVDASYISGGNIWLANYDGTSVWNINGSSLSASKPDNMYYVRPVVTIKASVTLKSGTGTKDDPYVIQDDNKELKVGSYVKMDEDELVVYDVENDVYKLSFTKSLLSRAYNTSGNAFDPKSKTSIAYYLNNDLYSTISYKDKLVETDWYNGSYDSYADISKSTVKAKVGLLNVNDIKFTDATNYYLMTPSGESKEYIYSESIVDVKPTIKENIVPTIAINKLNISSGSGTKNDPYILEVK